jgi:hypothetical protein
MKDEQISLHAAVITEATLDYMYSTIGNYMEDVLDYDPYEDDFAETHDNLMFEVIKIIANTKFSIK